MNEADNGLELLRALFVENEGGAEQVELGGMSNLHSCPPCSSTNDMLHYIGEWNKTRMQHGQGLPDMHLRQMFLNMLPEKVASECRKKPELNTMQKCIDHVMKDIGRYQDQRLARGHAERLKYALSHGQKNPVHSLITESEAPTEPQGGAEKSMVCALSEKIDGLVAALHVSQQRGRSPARDQRKNRDYSRPRSGSPKGN